MPPTQHSRVLIGSRAENVNKTEKQTTNLFFFIECRKWNGSESYEYPVRIRHQSQFQANFEKSSLKIALVGNVFNTVWHLHGPQSD